MGRFFLIVFLPLSVLNGCMMTDKGKAGLLLEDRYFYMPTHHSEFYTEFRDDGSYITYMRGYDQDHFVSDSGTWRLLENRVLEIESKDFCSDILSAPFWVSIIYKENIPLLPLVAKRINDRLMTGDDPPVFKLSGNDVFVVITEGKLAPIYLKLMPEKCSTDITREALALLVDRIDDYLVNPDDHNRKFRLVKTRGETFLMPLNFGRIEHNSEDKFVDFIQKEELPPVFVYMAISKKEFTKEIFSKGAQGTPP